MEGEKWIILYSALLHDIGKFIQREYVGTEFVEHQQAAAIFIEEAPFPKCLEGHKTLIKNIVGSHHKNEYYPQPEEKLENLLKILKIADELSEKWRQPIEEKESILSTPLLSIFHEVKLNEAKTNSSGKLYFNIQELKLDDTIIPKSIDKLRRPFTQNYKQLLQNFRQDFSLTSKIDSPQAHFITLYHLLLKYTFFVPSVTVKHEPVISLFEHLSTTCAIASSLYQSMEKGEGKILLIGGDVCRIQSFVYTITSEHAAKMLRGRSFFIHLLNKTVAHYILRKLGLEMPNIIWCGGGNFTIIAPHSEENIKLLEKAIREINTFLLKKFEGELQIAIGFIAVDPQDLKNFGAVISRLGLKLEEAKHRQFTELLPEAYSDVFGPKKEAANEVCDVCKKPTPMLKEMDGLYVCEACKSFENIGSKLAKSQYILMLTYDPSNPIKIDKRKEQAQNFEDLGFGYILALDRKELKTILKELSASSSIKLLNVISLNSTEFLEEEIMREPDVPTAFSFEFIGKYIPTDEKGQALSFDSIVRGQQAADILGVLRMDVDHLGKIFFKGLGEEASISSISTMSRLLSMFFDGYLSWYIEDKFKGKIYIVYSGGDDLFFVGRWDAICDLSIEIHKKFSEMASGNLQVTISSGIVLADPKWPVYRLAEASKDFLSQSKNKGRNRTTMFSSEEDCTVTWQELEKLKNLKDKLHGMIQANVLSRGFLFHLRNIHREYEREEEEYKDTGLTPQRYKWLLRYAVARQISQNQKLTKELLNLECEIQNCIKNLDIPLIWADLLTRTSRARR